METRSKVTLSCAGVLLLLLVGIVTAVVMFTRSLATSPIEGWLEEPHTPSPSLTVSVSPEPPPRRTGHR